MTKEDARKILEASEYLKPQRYDDDEDDVIHYARVGDFYHEYEDGFGFAVYPYNSEEPIDPTYAFEYFVIKETGEITSASAPMVKWELAGLTPPACSQ